MSEVKEAAEVLPIGAVEGRPGVTVVDQDNFQDYVTQQMGPPAGVGDESVNEDPEAAALAEQAKADEEKKAADAIANAPKEGDVDGNKVFFKGKWKDKSDFGYRLHLKGQETEKAAQAKVDAAAAEAKAAKEASEKLAQENAALKAKYEPAKSEELGPKPAPSDYIKDGLMDVDGFSAAMETWVADKTRREDAAKQADAQAQTDHANLIKSWQERKATVQAEIPDYAQVIEASDVKLSQEATNAVLKAPNGHKILYHFAQNPEEATALRKLTVGDMLMEIGRLNGVLGGTAKPAAKSETKAAPSAEISRAPAPITPLKGANPGSGLKIDAKGNWTGTYEEFKAAVNAGKL